MATYVYSPTVCLYGIIRFMETDSPLSTICNPFFGIKKVALKNGCLIWSVQIALMAVTLCEFFVYQTTERKPIIFNLLNL